MSFAGQAPGTPFIPLIDNTPGISPPAMPIDTVLGAFGPGFDASAPGIDTPLSIDFNSSPLGNGKASALSVPS